MPPKKSRERDVLLAAVRGGIGKAAASDAIRDPGKDVQVDAMAVDAPGECNENAPDTETAVPLEPDSGYCNFCGCKAQALRRCSACRAAVCEQPSGDARGCVLFRSGAAVDFVCPHCARMGLRKGNEYCSYGGRKHSKITWPLVVVNIETLDCVDPFLRRSLEGELRCEYAAQPENLVVASVGMGVGRAREATSTLLPAAQFVRQSTRCGWPANVAVVLQSRSNPATGALFYGTQSETPAFSTLPLILDAFVGGDVKAAMQDASAKASQGTRLEGGSWFQECASSRGGWRLLVVLGDGPAICVPARKDEAVGLVERGLVDGLITFVNQAVVPAHARAFISSMVRAMAVDNVAEAKGPSPPSLWAAFTSAIKACPVILESSPVVFIFKERGIPAEQPPECRQVRLHAPPFNAWGVQFRSCGNGCDVTPSDVTFRTDKGAIRCRCVVCGWRSCRVREDDLRDMVWSVCPDLPLVFWHAYPPSPSLLRLFPTITSERRD
ncbi:hypothetical protein HD554DRAFT_2172540 [Boletus coccyginus]|nr:hypothetical protein HD554DRAFT_2172540 [Boletus coccyginus]